VEGLVVVPRLLDVSNLAVHFRSPGGIVKAVDSVSFELDEGETLGIVGESGCGKSVSVLSLLRLVADPPGRIASGAAWFRGRDLLALSDDALRKVRWAEIAMIFQDPQTALNPVLTVGSQIAEPLVLHRKMNRRQARERAAELLDSVGIPSARSRLDDYPHQFSGGMRQRALIAMALSCSPRLLIADEPTTALDVTLQAQTIDLVKQLQRQLGMAMIWISHDLGVVAGLASRVLVMYAGRVVEEAGVEALYAAPAHPYTVGLLRSVPRLDQERGARLAAIPGQPPDPASLGPGCPFAPRCGYAVERCRREAPSLEVVGEGHRVACFETTGVRGAPARVS
jgi:oligopeptide transport system ATP-binding protein